MLGEKTAPTGSMFLGRQVDDAITLYYRHLLDHGERLSVDQIKDAFWDGWKAAADAEHEQLGIAWETDLREDSAFKLGIDAVELTVSELIPHLGKPVAIQRKVEYTLAPGLEWSVLCYLDLETRRADAGALLPAVIDYKVKTTPLTRFKADHDFQPGVYLAGRWLEGDPAAQFCFAQIAKPGPRRKEIGASIVTTSRSTGQLRVALARIGQVFAEIVRDVLLDQRAAVHELLKVQDVYRGVALSNVLLDQAFPLYRQIGLDQVLVHAAMETGRWHWARLGFDFLEADDRTIVMAWALGALGGLGKAAFDPNAPARRLAQLGSGSPQETASMQHVRVAVQAQVAAWGADPAMKPNVDALVAEWDRRSLAETGGQFDMLDADRVRVIAARNRLQVTDQIAPGKAIMLTGPDWWGAFDLHDQATADAFDREFSRCFSGLS